MESIGDCIKSDISDENDEVFELANEEFPTKTISKSQMNLPHALGSLPHYLSSKPSSTLNKSESSLSLGLFEFSDDKMDYLKRQVLHLSSQARESNEKAFKMTKILDKFRQNSNEMKKELRSCELKLSEKDDRIKTLSNQLRLQKDKISQISKLEEKIANLQQMNQGYQNENKLKDERIEKFASQINRMKRDIELKEKKFEAKSDEVENWKKKFEKFQQQLKNNEIEGDTKNVQINLLKMDLLRLEEENVR